MEHRPPELHPGRHRGGLWRFHSGGQHSVSLLWDVEDHLLLAHRGHGPVQHQLPSLWGAQVLVSVEQWFSVEGERITMCGYKQTRRICLTELDN